MTGSLAAEAARQAAFVERLHAVANDDPAAGAATDRLAEGWRVYRRHAAAVAARALASAFPTVARQVGDDAMRRLAAEAMRIDPPMRGDLGEWGATFPAILAAREALRPWPWLADSARLDLAVHHAERAADAAPDRATLRLLGDADPAALRLVLAPGTSVVASDWPIATLYDAHRADDPEAALDQARDALAARRGEAVMVVREGWRAVPVRLDRRELAFTRALLERATLDAALDRAACGDDGIAGAAGGAVAGFDFAAWLVRAVAAGWLQSVERVVADESADQEGEGR